MEKTAQRKNHKRRTKMLKTAIKIEEIKKELSKINLN